MKPEEVERGAISIATMGAILIAGGVVGVSACWGGWLFFWSAMLTWGLYWHFVGIKGLQIAYKMQKKDPMQAAREISESLSKPGDRVDITITPEKSRSPQ